MLNENLEMYVAELTAAYPGISSVWLIGSRANGTERVDSDWDFLVFANQSVLAQLRADTQFHKESVDLLVVYDGSNFENAWGSRKKTGDLKRWRWHPINETLATYEGTKDQFNEAGEEEFNVIVRTEKAIRVFSSCD